MHRRDLRLLAGAVCLSAAGDLLTIIVLALQVHDLTGSAAAVSGFFAATMLPVVAVAGLAGRITDRFESVRVLVLASLAQAAVASALAFSSGELAAILALSALLAAGSAISQPAEFALVSVVAGGDGRALLRANGVVESARYLGFALGPLAAAALAAGAGTRAALLVNAATFVAIALAAAAMRSRRPAPQSAGVAAEGERGGGVRLLLRDPVLAPTVLACTGALLLISAVMTIEVFYAKDVLGAGDAGYALITAAWMAGMVAGAVVLAPRVPTRVLAAGALVALAVQGAGVAGQTVWVAVPSAVAGYLVGGLGHGVKNTLVRTLIQRRVAATGHGRAFAAYNAARNGAELVALAAGGLIVSAVGARTGLVVAGLGPVLAGAAGLAVLRAARASAPSAGT